MAQFIAFNKDVEVIGASAIGFAESFRKGKAIIEPIFAKHNFAPTMESWHNVQIWLDVLRDIADTVGEMTILWVGMTIIDTAPFPPMRGLEDALRSIDIAYHMNHRLHGEVMFNPQTGKMLESIGHYLLTEFDAKNRKAVMVCENPYSSKMDEGIITGVVRRFRPADSTSIQVKIDTTKERRTEGGNSCTYLISW